MIQLSVYRESDNADEPHILSFEELAPQVRRSRFRVVSEGASASERSVVPRILHELTALKARQCYHNSSCPACRRVTVEPIELNDAQISRNGAVRWGTATVVGFSCNACGHEWPA